MDLTTVIIGPITTEKSERMKTQRCYTLQVSPRATKIDVKNALKRFYGVDAVSVRVMRTSPKRRLVGAGQLLTKRPSVKKVIVTLAEKSKTLDLADFKAA